MVKPLRPGSAYIQPGKHRWRSAGSYVSKAGGVYGIFICYLCGVRCDTTAAFPSKHHSELWDGKRLKAREDRPKCQTSERNNEPVANGYLNR